MANYNLRQISSIYFNRKSKIPMVGLKTNGCLQNFSHP